MQGMFVSAGDIDDLLVENKRVAQIKELRGATPDLSRDAHVRALARAERVAVEMTKRHITRQFGAEAWRAYRNAANQLGAPVESAPGSLVRASKNELGVTRTKIVRAAT